MVNLSEIRGGLLVLAGLVVVLLLLAIATPGIPGELLLQSLLFHILAAGFVLLILMLLVGLRWRALVVFLVLLGPAAYGVVQVQTLQRPLDQYKAGPVATTLDVLSYNVLSNNETGQAAAQFIIEAAPDVAIIMEAPGVKAYFDEISSVLPYRLGCADGEPCDLVILSRYPLLDGEIHHMWPFRLDRLLTAHIEKDGVPVNIVGVHYSKPYFDMASWGETDQLLGVLRKIKGDLVLGGDFNAAPWSETLMHLAKEGQLVPPPSHPATWPVIAGPLGVPIDNLFTRGNARITQIAAGENSYGSNHRLLRAQVELYEAP